MAARREKSAEAVVAEGFGDRGPPQGEGPNSVESETTVDHAEAMHQMSNAQFELPLETRVKPRRTSEVVKPTRRPANPDAQDSSI